MTRLSKSDVTNQLAHVPGWHVEDDALSKEFTFKTFAGAMKFINQVADIARSSRHHPEIWNSYNRVRLTLTTHDEGGITEKDVAFARDVEETQNRA
jgi:4a-hydroxytetrahydrobiopterin dehydratase